MWRKWTGVAALLAVSWVAFGQGMGTAPGGSSGKQTVKKVVYVVQPADTLWDIAGRFLNSPYYWPKIWERNSFITDPNLIFPGDVLNLYPESEKLTPEVVETVPKMGEEKPQAGATVTTPRPEAGGTETKVVRDEYGRAVRVIYKEPSGTGWIESGEFEKAGRIVKTTEDHKMVAAYEHVWVNLGEAMGVKVGDIFSIFKIDKTIYHPVTKKKLGYKILNLGKLQVVNLNENAAEGEIIQSYNDAQVGDYIRPYVPPLSAEVPVVAGTTKLEGYVVASLRDTPSFGQNDIVYIDLGKNQGVVPGNAFEIYEPGANVSDKGKKLRLPDVVIGVLVVLDARDNTSVALVTESLREMILGNRIRTAPSR